MVAAAPGGRRVLEPVEARLMLMAGILLLILAVLFWFFPRALTYPLGILMVWFALSLIYRGYKLHFAQDWLGGNEQGAELGATSDKDDHQPAKSQRTSTNQETM